MHRADVQLDFLVVDDHGLRGRGAEHLQHAFTQVDALGEAAHVDVRPA